MDAAQIVALVIGAIFSSGGLVALLAYFKFKPGQKERVGIDVATADVTVAQANLNIAQGTIELVAETYEEQFRRMNGELETMRRQHAAEIDTMRREHAGYRRDTEGQIAELGAQLRGAKAENQRLTHENADLRAQAAEATKLRRRVDDLEAEVQRLKGERP